MFTTENGVSCRLKLAGEEHYILFALAVCDRCVQCGAFPSPAAERTWFCGLFTALCLVSVLPLCWAGRQLQQWAPKVIRLVEKRARKGVGSPEVLWLPYSVLGELWSGRRVQLALERTQGLGNEAVQLVEVGFLVQDCQSDKVCGCSVVSLKSPDICFLIMSPSCAPSRVTKHPLWHHGSAVQSARLENSCQLFALVCES